MPWTREEKIYCVTTYLETKNIQNCLKTDATYLYNNHLLLRHETQTKIACHESW